VIGAVVYAFAWLACSVLIYALLQDQEDDALGKMLLAVPALMFGALWPLMLAAAALVLFVERHLRRTP
jgi:hypothetical protein